ncbi:MAG: hypothetical protein FK733_03530 [Asgard group archaeon]|nr:hypothetical protein [Asgard group archaeon]
MKVLYGLNSNGQGHINRSKVFIDQLEKDGHEVHVLFSGRKPPEYALEMGSNTIYIYGPEDLYKNRRVDFGKMLSQNLANISGFIDKRREIIAFIGKENYDLIISDFENFSCYAAKRLCKPIIIINRQNAIFHPSNKLAPGNAFEKMSLRMLYAIMQPHYTHAYSLDFRQDIKTIENDTLFPLVWKPELNDYDITIDNHITAYLAWYDPEKIIETFSKFPKQTFYVYGFNKYKKVKNIVFKETSRDGFLKDLVSSKGIIGNGGFNLSWEACLLNKFIWSIPIVAQYEQMTNAYRLEQNGIGFVTYKVSEASLENYLKWIESQDYRPKTNLTILQPSDLLKHMYSFLDNYNRQYLPNRRQLKRDIKVDVNRWRMRQEIRKEISIHNSSLS